MLMSVPVDDPVLDTRAAAQRLDVAYVHFVRLRSAGHTPPPDGWRGKRALYRASTLDAWWSARNGKQSWKTVRASDSTVAT
jgi:hypothetical protein